MYGGTCIGIVICIHRICLYQWYFGIVGDFLYFVIWFFFRFLNLSLKSINLIDLPVLAFVCLVINGDNIVFSVLLYMVFYINELKLFKILL